MRYLKMRVEEREEEFLKNNFRIFILSVINVILEVT